MEFRRETVEVFFFVFVDVCKESVLGGGDCFDGEKIIEGKIAASFAWAVCNNSMVKNIEFFDGGREIRVDKRIKVGIKCLEDGDWTFVCGIWFVNECATCNF